MKKMVRAVLFAMMAVFSTAVLAEEDPCEKPANLTEIDGVYQIGTCGDLYKFAEMVNGGETDINGKLTADIVVNEGVLRSDGTLNGNGSKFIQWTPIGTYEIPYAGTFDGAGHVISGLYFNNEGASYVGLFGFISDKAKVQNVGVVDSYILGRGSVGGVVGNNSGTVSNVYNTGAVSGDGWVGGVVGYNDGDLSNVYNTGAVSGEYGVGGVVGLNEGGTVSNVYNIGAVSADSEVGGVVGDNGGTVSNVYNTGAVSGDGRVGGVVGLNEGGTVSNVYNTGAVSGEYWVGGVVGVNGYRSTVSNVYNTGAVSGYVYVGGVVGNNDGGSVKNAYYNTDFYTGDAVGTCDRECEYENVEGKSTAELASTTLPAGFFGEIWKAGGEPVVRNGKLLLELPGLKDVGTQPGIEYTGFQPSADGFYEISNALELKCFAQLVNSGAASINGRLTADICLNACGEGESVLKADGTLNGDGSNFTQWTPIGTVEKPYKGTFDGKDAEGNVHVISGLYFNDEDADYVGLFKYNEGMVQNVGVVDSYIRGAVTVGGVVGSNAGGIISNVYNTGAVSGTDRVGGVVGAQGSDGDVSDVYNAGAVSGNRWVGGVVGWNEGGAVSNVYNAGAVSGKSCVGGVVGYNEDGIVRNVYNTGAVSGKISVGGVVGYNGGKTVSNVYNTGAVSGNQYVGGVVGSNDGRSVENAYYNTDFYTGSAVGINAEEAIVDNAEGKTTAELASTTLPAGFSSEIWNAGSGEPVVRNGKLLLKLPGLKNVGSQPEIEYTGFQPNAGGFYEISNAQELKWFAQLVNSGATSINGRLTADICLNACGEGEGVLKADGTLNGDGSNFTQWIPIGTAEKPYAGTFDGKDAEGNAHVISGLYFNDENVDYVGLFGSIGENAKVQNVGVEDSYILGKNVVGGVVGVNAGSVGNVYNTGAVSGDVEVGGVVGHNDGTVSNVYNTGAVSGNEWFVGGVVGQNLVGSISNVYNTGAVSGYGYVGGVVGFDYSVTISNAYFNTDFFTGNALGSGDDVENVGGKTSAELAAGTDVVLDADFWVVGAVSENAKQDTLYYPYLKVFGPHKYVLGDVKKYAITVAVNDKAMGSVTGAGEYEYGTTVKLSATANEGYKFTDWEDDVKTAARMITVTKAETYTANFEAISSSSSVAESSSSVDESSSSEAVSSSSEAKSSSSEAKSSSSDAKSSSSSAKSSSSSAKSSSSEAKSSSSDAKSSSSQKESIIAQAQLPQFSVTASGKMVSIAGARPNSIVNVFDMQGNMVRTVVATSANFTFALPSAGVYIVKNGYTAKRVNVR